MLEASTIREATEADLPAIDELVRAHAPGCEHVTYRREGAGRHRLVLDASDGGLAAAAVVTIEAQCGHLDMLVVAPRFAGHGLEARMLGVAESLCVAFGAEMLDVVARHAA